MIEVFDFHEGESPLLISIPHEGTRLPDDLAARMSAAGRSVPDTDWHVARLYEFAKEIGASMLVARFSRYVVDLNRPADDAQLYPGQVATGLCPQQTFAGEAIYTGEPEIDVAGRVARYWRPYHDQLSATLSRLHARHGHALLWDAHSIASRVPRLFDGELPVLNIGTFDGRSCAGPLAAAVYEVAQDSPYPAVRDARFKGGFITRRYGEPDRGIHALQLELAQRAYMNEQSGTFDESQASQLRDTLRAMLDAFRMRA